MDTSLTEISSKELRLAVSDLGAEMQFLRTSDGRDLLWHGDATFWGGRSPVLFPIVGGAPGDEIAVGAHRAPMRQHGFARRMAFERVAHSPDMCRHALRDTDATRAVYPFEFTLEVTHTLEGNGLRIAALVQNHSAQTMPFGFGFHPAFAWPLPGAEGQLHEVNLASQSAPLQRPLEQGLLSRDLIPGPIQNGHLALTGDLFDKDALVFPNAAEPLRYGVPGQAELAFAFENLPDLALWSKPGAPFLCVEPWHGTAALQGDGPEITDRPNSFLLPAGEQAQFAMTVTTHL